MCQVVHVRRREHDFVCEKGHGCAPVPFDDQKFAELQGKDARCKKN